MAATFSISNALALQEMQVIVDGVVANPVGYKIPAPEFASVVSAVGTFATALSVAENPSTRTSGTIAARNDARDFAERAIRPFIMRIKYDTTIPAQMKLNIGIKPPGGERTPRPPLNEPPILAVIGATSGTQTLRYVALDGIEGAKKPEGATAIQVYMKIADQPINDPADAQFYSAFTRNPMPVVFTQADNKKVATYFARWTNPKGQFSPWSAAASMTIAA